MAKMKNFGAALEDLGIDPQAWASARAAEGDQYDYRLARDLEELVEAAEFDRCIELNPGENLLDVWSILWTALSRWPLATKATA